MSVRQISPLRQLITEQSTLADQGKQQLRSDTRRVGKIMHNSALMINCLNTYFN